MPNLPIRGLGMVGVITDVSPYDLPKSAWSNARNVRFEGDAVTRTSVFKPFVLQQSFSSSPPIYIVDDSLRSTAKSITTFREDGTITRVADGIITDVSPTTPMNLAIGNVTGTIIGSVSYINNGIDAPISYTNGEAHYSTIPYWKPQDRCKALRSFGDYLIALNVSTQFGNFPNMVKWSNPVMVGERPDWNFLDDPDTPLDESASSLAGENVLNGSTGHIVDGLELGNMFIIYGSREAFLMTYIGEPLIFEIRKLFNNFAIMTQNCVVEVKSRHFVFCEDDIVTTDGGSYESICDGKIRKAIFSRLDYSKRNECRVIHNSLKSEILFCYPSMSGDARWQVGSRGCNEAAVYNYSTNTWTFVDLPNVTSGFEADHPIGALETGKVWEGLIGSWQDQRFSWAFTTASPMTLVISAAGSQDKTGNVYFYDDDIGGRIGNSVDPDLYWPAYAEMTLNDYDELGIPLMAQKWVTSITPQVNTETETDTVTFFLKSDGSTVNASSWSNPISFSPFSQYQIDTRVVGRFISLRYEIPDNTFAKFSGFDINVSKLSER